MQLQQMFKTSRNIKNCFEQIPCHPQAKSKPRVKSADEEDSDS